jgi:PKD repeat protein
MKTKFLFILSLIILFQFKLNAQDCEAWFYSVIDADPYTVSFYDESVPLEFIESWSWDFGDGNSSTNRYPVHTYDTEGTFYVSLTITTSNCADTYIDSVFISEEPQEVCFADFIFEISLDDFRTINFSDQSQSDQTIESWFWTFGDGSTSEDQNPTHVFSSDTIYPVTLQIEAGDCIDSVTYIVPAGETYFQGEDCFAAFSFEKLGPAGLTFQFWNASYFAGDSLLSSVWDFGDGNTSELQNPFYTFSDIGEYEVSLMIETESCIDTFTLIVFAGEEIWYPDSCQALFYFYRNPDNYLEHHFFDFSYINDENAYWFWDFGDGASSTSTINNPVYEFQEEGIYEVNLFVETSTCISNFPMEIHVFDNASSGDSLMPIFFPEPYGDMVRFHNLTRGEADSWYWDFGDGSNSAEYSPVHSFEGNGVHEVALSAYRGEVINTVVIRFNTDAKKSKSTDIIDYAYFYPGGISSSGEPNIMRFSVYPNPANDMFTIVTDQNPSLVEIFDITGTLIFNSVRPGKTVNISNLPKGIYLIRISANDMTATLKLIKE